MRLYFIGRSATVLAGLSVIVLCFLAATANGQIQHKNKNGVKLTLSAHVSKIVLKGAETRKDKPNYPSGMIYFHRQMSKPYMFFGPASRGTVKRCKALITYEMLDRIFEWAEKGREIVIQREYDNWDCVNQLIFSFPKVEN